MYTILKSTKFIDKIKLLNNPITTEKLNKINEVSIQMDKIICELQNKKIPYKYPNEITNVGNLNFIPYREKVIELSSYAMVSKSWVKPLSEWIGSKKCLEIMAGRGVLAKTLKDYGTNIIATDSFEWTDMRNNLWTDVKQYDCVNAIKKYGENVDIVICSWPYMDDNAYKSLCMMNKINPNLKMIYIGEDTINGCNANKSFLKTIKVINDSKFNFAVKNYQNWAGLYDKILLLKSNALVLL